MRCESHKRECTTTHSSARSGVCTCSGLNDSLQPYRAPLIAGLALLKQNRDVRSKILCTRSQKNPFCLTLLRVLPGHLQAKLRFSQQVIGLYLPLTGTHVRQGCNLGYKCFWDHLQATVHLAQDRRRPSPPRLADVQGNSAFMSSMLLRDHLEAGVHLA